MNRECQTAQEAIWDRARDGRPLDEQTRGHISQCAACAQAAHEVSLLSGAVGCASHVNQAPDCRSEVMQRIAREGLWQRVRGLCCFGKSLSRNALTLAVAAVALVAIVAIGLARMAAAPSPTGTGRQAGRGLARFGNEFPKHRRVERSPVVSVMKTAKAPGRRVPQTSALTTPQHQPRKRTARSALHLPKVRTVRRERQPDDRPVVIELANRAKPGPSALTGPRPIAVAEVTWPAGDDQSIDNYSYSYTDRDTQTGAVTKCSVRREGDSIDIHVETVPAETDQPRKGSIENGKTSDV